MVPYKFFNSHKLHSKTGISMGPKKMFLQSLRDNSSHWIKSHVGRCIVQSSNSIHTWVDTIINSWKIRWWQLRQMHKRLWTNERKMTRVTGTSCCSVSWFVPCIFHYHYWQNASTFFFFSTYRTTFLTVNWWAHAVECKNQCHRQRCTFQMPIVEWGSYHYLIYEIVDQVHNLIPCKNK